MSKKIATYSMNILIVLGMISASIAFMISPTLHSALAASPTTFGWKDGSLITASTGTDTNMYIVSNGGFRRVVINPAILNMYGHLNGLSAHRVALNQQGAFPVSGLFRNCETGDQKVYALEVTGSTTGTLHWVNISGSQAVAADPKFFKKVFCINSAELNSYTMGSDYMAYDLIPASARGNINATSTLVISAPSGVTLVDPRVGQQGAEIARFTLTGSGSEDSQINTLTLANNGTIFAHGLKNIFIKDMATGQVVASSNGLEGGVMNFNFNSGVMVKPGETRTYSVVGDVTLSAQNNDTIRLYLWDPDGMWANSSNTGLMSSYTFSGYDNSIGDGSDASWVTVRQ